MGNMVRKYEKSDYKEVESWFHKRDIPITEDYLPPTGFIDPGKTAGFIFRTDGNFCVFECFISSPDISKFERQMSLRDVVSEMIKEAKKLGFKDAFGFATSQTMITIGAEQGFKFIETCSTIQKDLR